ncbi:major histocompatibility complex class I-related gene protein [Amia ocellicauda]|uniref:major histocompatibility complex class I-related gene protein n=1 Tax=Amia ocellicauda TaxID=2972642 RepID=UPI003464AB6E
MLRALLALFAVQCACAANHSLHYVCTGASGPVAVTEVIVVTMLDKEELSYYNTTVGEVVPRQEWLKDEEGLQGWKINSYVSVDTLNSVRTAGIATLQQMWGCKQGDDNATRYFWQYGYKGKDYLTLDTNTWAFTTVSPWHPRRTPSLKSSRTYLQQHCLEWLKKLLEHGREALDRKVPHEVSVHYNGCELSCLATGFFPRDIVLSWQRDGQELHEGVESGELLPNGDGTYQVTKSLRLSGWERLWHTFSCHVKHASLEEASVTYWGASLRRSLCVLECRAAPSRLHASRHRLSVEPEPYGLRGDVEK